MLLRAMSRNRLKDTVSSAGAQICNVGNIMTVWFLVMWLETACRQEHDLMSTVESVGSSGIHFNDVRKRENLKLCGNYNDEENVFFFILHN